MAVPRAVPSPVSASPVSPTSPASSNGQIPLGQPPKLKGRRKLLQSLQRMSSSPSLIRRGRSHSAGYRRDGKASLSCVSLSQSAYNPCLGNGSSSQVYGGLNVHPVTPGVPGEEQDGGPRIRVVGTDSPNASQLRTVPLPTELRPVSRGSPCNEMVEDIVEESESVVQPVPTTPSTSSKKTFDFWGDMPNEIKMRIFQHLTPKEIVRCSSVSKIWHDMCYDGQLWVNVDTTDYYHTISSDSLVRLIMAAGPFIRNLNLRGCVQLRDKWLTDGDRMSETCRNLVNLCLEGSRIDKHTVNHFLQRNPRLEYLNVTGLPSVTDSSMKTIANCCPQLQILNVSWCINISTKGLKKVVTSCPQLKDLRASEISGFEDEEFALGLFEKNTLERLVMSRTNLTDESLKILMQGVDPEIDVLTDQPIVPPRRFKHLDLHQCPNVTDDGIGSMAHNVPDLEGLQLSQCPELSDDSIIDLIRTTPKLSHLELEDLEHLTNDTLIALARSPCAPCLEHLNISFCDSLGDIGMLQVMKSCLGLRSVEMDNTRVSDLTLMEASYRVRRRGYDRNLPQVGLHMVVFDCANVTWAGVKEVLSSNAYIPRAYKNQQTIVTVSQTQDSEQPASSTSPSTSALPPPPPVYPNEIIQLKCFYGWQMTVDEHKKRVLRGDLAAASRLDRKWADYMMATEEAGATGMGVWRRRRRAREAERLFNTNEDEDVYGIGGISAFGGRRRRAQSGGACAVM
ncbi:F-box domain protein [Aspergillus glaucus CBS 516.65]|uniref:F-box domain-containing protein n=1 Tax=Aspergillus glaucus CBS 516.65 TaxID=1160497 RepID=A0A1L9VSH4_ASPGL|nr:hypothetical protein ASPGLDRAFT_22958 [Aspergillus glaucus CBS 516.65]OJJ86878.1 hypothetical protein ASPGLDRAFT_22958 [Aspergillus glaucus CBS 516.65]